MYEFKNVQDRPMVAQAIPSYARRIRPARTSTSWIASASASMCCSLARAQWPVVFVIDPKLPRDVKTITLSYTFFEVPGKERSQAGGARRPGCGHEPGPARPFSARCLSGRPVSAVAWSFFGVRRGGRSRQ